MVRKDLRPMDDWLCEEVCRVQKPAGRFVKFKSIFVSEILLNNVSSKCVRYGSVKNGFGDTSVEISAVAVGLSGLVYLAEPYITRAEPVAFVRFQI